MKYVLLILMVMLCPLPLFAADPFVVPTAPAAVAVNPSTAAASRAACILFYFFFLKPRS